MRVLVLIAYVSCCLFLAFLGFTSMYIPLHEESTLNLTVVEGEVLFWSASPLDSHVFTPVYFDDREESGSETQSPLWGAIGRRLSELDHWVASPHNRDASAGQKSEPGAPSSAKVVSMPSRRWSFTSPSRDPGPLTSIIYSVLGRWFPMTHPGDLPPSVESNAVPVSGGSLNENDPHWQAKAHGSSTTSMGAADKRGAPPVSRDRMSNQRQQVFARSGQGELLLDKSTMGEPKTIVVLDPRYRYVYLFVMTRVIASDATHGELSETEIRFYQRKLTDVVWRVVDSSNAYRQQLHQLGALVGCRQYPNLELGGGGRKGAIEKPSATVGVKSEPGVECPMVDEREVMFRTGTPQEPQGDGRVGTPSSPTGVPVPRVLHDLLFEGEANAVHGGGGSGINGTHNFVEASEHDRQLRYGWHQMWSDVRRGSPALWAINKEKLILAVGYKVVHGESSVWEVSLYRNLSGDGLSEVAENGKAPTLCGWLKRNRVTYRFAGNTNVMSMSLSTTRLFYTRERDTVDFRASIPLSSLFDNLLARPPHLCDEGERDSTRASDVDEVSEVSEVGEDKINTDWAPPELGVEIWGEDKKGESSHHTLNEVLLVQPLQGHNTGEWDDFSYVGIVFRCSVGECTRSLCL
eukprot:GHVN01028486.1.p1 GENE.GHVN01028486.1~~GHVN01028486.1.p1  ORF type:complete len:633 (+),score=100.34 GHVN01028486.1:244-2142(+)